jgi:hypothetical protein
MNRNAGGKSLVQFCEKIPNRLGAALSAGVQVDIDGQVRQSRQRGKSVAPVAGYGPESQFPQDVQGVQVKTVPGRGEDRQKMLAKDIGELVPAAEYVPPFLLITCARAEFRLPTDS